MSKCQRAPLGNDWIDEIATENPTLILEKHLQETIQLCGKVQQARIGSDSTVPRKTRLLFDSMNSELQFFITSIQKHLESRSRGQLHVPEMPESSYWRLFPVESQDLREQLEALLCGYARYARNTSKASARLLRAGDLDGFELLSDVFKGVDRCLWFLEIHLEGVALKVDDARLPDWPAGADRGDLPG